MSYELAHFKLKYQQSLDAQFNLHLQNLELKKDNELLKELLDSAQSEIKQLRTILKEIESFNDSLPEPNTLLAQTLQSTTTSNTTASAVKESYEFNSSSLKVSSPKKFIKSPAIVAPKESTDVNSYKPLIPTYVPSKRPPLSEQKMTPVTNESSVATTPVLKTEPENTENTKNLITSIQPDSLMSWQKYIKMYRPSGTLTQLTKQQKEIINTSFHTFLTGKVSPELIPNCFVIDEYKFKGETKQRIVNAIPESLVAEFNVWFDKAMDDGLLGRTKENKPLEKDVDDLEAWSEIISKEFPSSYEQILEDRSYMRRVQAGLQDFLKLKCPTLQPPRKPSECRLTFKEDAVSIRVVAIPFALKNDFLTWFELQNNNMFYDYDLASMPMKPKKRKLEDTQDFVVNGSASTSDSDTPESSSDETQK